LSVEVVGCTLSDMATADASAPASGENIAVAATRPTASADLNPIFIIFPFYEEYQLLGDNVRF
ncbi:hypothetical protein, partial [Corynebacterium sp.]|uniref:hypothetical protein n=1 Tax=Corynebacterium sp. TaxID=1720 RepID=UPI00257C7E54